MPVTRMLRLSLVVAFAMACSSDAISRNSAASCIPPPRLSVDLPMGQQSQFIWRQIRWDLSSRARPLCGCMCQCS